ncbi:MAG: hypothetical protein HXY40_02180 [Chloroflexi bacterium]|nr:hypothetical protein [Chloroflexota bacterium]
MSLHRVWRYAVVYFFYMALSILITWPLVTVFSTRLVGDNNGDAYEYARHVWWYRHALQTGQPLFEQPLLAYPDGLTSWYLWGNPLRTFPAWLLAFFLPLPAAFNLMLLLRLALNGAAMCWTAYQFTRSRSAALIAGTIYLAYPAMQGQMLAGHVDLLALWAVPLYLWSLFTLTDSGGRPAYKILRTGFLFMLCLVGNFVLLVYVLFPITALFLLARLWQRDWPSAGRVLLAAASGSALALIFVLPAVLELLSMPALREGGSVRFSADLLALVSPSFQHPIYQFLGYNRAVLGLNMSEGSGYIGLFAAALALVGVGRVRAARWLLLLAFTAWVFSLGPLLNIRGAPLVVSIGSAYQTYMPLPWALFQSLPLLDISRTPGRFNFVVGLCVALLAAYGISRFPVTQWMRARKAFPALKSMLTALLIALIIFDYQAFWPLPTIPAQVPAAIAALAQRDDVRAVFNVPWDNLLAAKEALYLQTAHGLPLIAGHITRQTPVNPALLTILQETLDPALLRQAGADVVIVQRAGYYDADGTLFARAQRQLGAPLYADETFAVFDVPASDTLSPLVVSPPASTFENSGALYVYNAQRGWLTLLTRVTDVGQNPQLTITLDSIVNASARAGLAVVPLHTAGYHTINFSVQPHCPPHYAAPLLTCNARIEAVIPMPEAFVADDFAAPVTFANGVTLRGAQLAHQPGFDGTMWALLWWRFAAPPPAGAVRFVKVLDVQGEQVAGSDETLVITTEQLAEALPLDTVLPAGEYRVYVGWYTYPDLNRFALLSGGGDARAQDQLAYIGSFLVENP